MSLKALFARLKSKKSSTSVTAGTEVLSGGLQMHFVGQDEQRALDARALGRAERMVMNAAGHAQVLDWLRGVSRMDERSSQSNVLMDRHAFVGPFGSDEVMAQLGVRGEGEEPAGVGSIHATEKGSGARYNADKPPLHYIPIHVWHAFLLDEQQWEVPEDAAHSPVDGGKLDEYEDLLEMLAKFQAREAAAAELLGTFSPEEIAEGAWVFEYGANKYAGWNWAKGMAWSIPIGCIMRHLDAVFRGEEYDEESGRKHVGHVVCNIVMLAHYEQYYPEGDDRPPAECF